MNNRIKDALLYASPVVTALLLSACTGPNVPKDTLICGQDDSISRRDPFGNMSSIHTRQICVINQDGSFTVKDVEKDEN